jgi:hypothetical protein
MTTLRCRNPSTCADSSRHTPTIWASTEIGSPRRSGSGRKEGGGRYAVLCGTTSESGVVSGLADPASRTSPWSSSRKASRLLPDRCRARFYKTHPEAPCWHWDNKMYDCTGFPRSLTCRFTHRCQVAYEPILMKALHGMSRLVLAPRMVFGQIRNCFSYSRSSFCLRSAPGVRPSRARGSQRGAGAREGDLRPSSGLAPP